MAGSTPEQSKDIPEHRFADIYERGYILVIKLEDDGSTTGMLYRTPLDK